MSHVMWPYSVGNHLATTMLGYIKREFLTVRWRKCLTCTKLHELVNHGKACNQNRCCIDQWSKWRAQYSHRECWTGSSEQPPVEMSNTVAIQAEGVVGNKITATNSKAHRHCKFWPANNKTGTWSEADESDCSVTFRSKIPWRWRLFAAQCFIRR